MFAIYRRATRNIRSVCFVENARDKTTAPDDARIKT